MFNKVISMPGFWRSVLSIGLAFALLFVIVKWAIEGFKIAYFTGIQNPMVFVFGLCISGFIYGFLVTFGKYRGKLKKDEAK